MCHYSVGYKYYDIKPTMLWRAEQHKRQRILRYEKTGFCVVGNLYEKGEFKIYPESFLALQKNIGLLILYCFQLHLSFLHSI